MTTQNQIPNPMSWCSIKSTVLITGIRTPTAAREGYGDIVGQVLNFTGNGYSGFEVKLLDGSRRDMIHFDYIYVSNTTPLGVQQ